ncbi:MAG: nodulation protein NfeD [Bacteroidales bacterium]|nr:nodulation protein NfeD [Bacteroidales bacterium]
MKRLITLIGALLCSCVAAFCSDSLAVIYRIRLDQDIDKSSQRLVVSGLEKASAAGADYVMLDLDTYGGAVDAADSIRSAILRYPKPVVAFVNMQAASAGALISIACDSIYMKRGSSIGAATVVDQSGNEMPDKYQSFMRGMMRSTAQATGRDPKVAEAMVDTAGVLSMTPEEAIKVGYCNAICDNEIEVAQQIAQGDGYVIRNMEDDMTWIDRLIQFLLNPLLQSIFMMMIIGGIFVEIRTPGIGLPLLTAVVGALLYFAPAYVGHLAANWEILLFVIGLVLIALELFVIPGFGVCGIAGIVAVIFSLAFAMIDNSELFHWDGSLNLMPVVRPLGIVIISAAVAIFGGVWIVRKLFPTRTFDHIALRQEMRSEEGFTGVVSGLESLVGETVTVFSDMRPGGKVRTADGRIIEATLKFGGFASKGKTLKVLSAEQGRLYCDIIN